MLQRTYLSIFILLTGILLFTACQEEDATDAPAPEPAPEEPASQGVFFKLNGEEVEYNHSYNAHYDSSYQRLAVKGANDMADNLSLSMIIELGKTGTFTVGAEDGPTISFRLIKKGQAYAARQGSALVEITTFNDSTLNAYFSGTLYGTTPNDSIVITEGRLERIPVIFPVE